MTSKRENVGKFEISDYLSSSLNFVKTVTIYI